MSLPQHIHIPPAFNKRLYLVRGQGVGGLNPLAPVILEVNDVRGFLRWFEADAKGSIGTT
jgi:hypothetical protein